MDKPADDNIDIDSSDETAQLCTMLYTHTHTKLALVDEYSDQKLDQSESSG